MSLLHDPNFTLYKLRSSYLRNVNDGGIGERTISIDHGFVNNANAFKAAGLRPLELKRSYSPPIAAGRSLASGLRARPPPNSESQESVDMNSRSRRRDSLPQLIRELEQEDDSTDLSGQDSGSEEELSSATQHIHFSKIPIQSSPRAQITTLGTNGGVPKELIGRSDPYKRNVKGAESVVDSEFESGSIFSDTPLVLPQPGFNNSATPLSFTKGRYFDGSDESQISSDFFADIGSLNLAASLGPINSNTRKRAQSIPKSLPPPQPITRIPFESALTSQIRTKDATLEDPLASYAAFTGKGELEPLSARIYRPSGLEPKKPFAIIVKRDITVADAIGYALYYYKTKGIRPPLTNEEKNPDRWTLKIVEDDGEPDLDFPALERSRTLQKYGFDEFALVEAAAASVEMEQSSALNNTMSKTSTDVIEAIGASSLKLDSIGADVNMSTSKPSMRLGPESGISCLIKVKMSIGGEHPRGITVSCTTETYIGEILERICKKSNLDKSQYSLRDTYTSVLIPPDRTVGTLQNHLQLELVKRRLYADEVATTLSNSSTLYSPLVFGTPKTRRRSVLQAAQSGSDILTSATYQRYFVWRRIPMSFMSRHERILSIDGEYVHIMPSEQKGIFETPKTVSLI